MLDRQLTEEEDAPYKKLYRLKIPADANPPISDNPPEDTVQALYAESGEVLVSFDPTVLEWYPSVVVLLPQHELFEHLLDELLAEVGGSNESEVTRVVGRFENGSPEIWADGSIDSSVEIATHATEAKRRISLGIPLPTTSEAEEGLSTWLRNKHISN